MLALLFSISFTSIANAKNESCITTEKFYIVQGSEIVDDMGSLDFDPSVAVSIQYTGSVCTDANDVSLMSTPAPDLAQPGDTRVITQTRGGWVYTYTQTFTASGGWTTTEFNQRYIGNDAMDK